MCKQSILLLIYIIVVYINLYHIHWFLYTLFPQHKNVKNYSMLKFPLKLFIALQNCQFLFSVGMGYISSKKGFITSNID